MKGPITIIIEHIDNGTIDIFMSHCQRDEQNETIILPNQMRISVSLFDELVCNPDFYRDFED